MADDSTNPAQKPVPTAPTKMQIWFPAGVWVPHYNWKKNVGPDLIAAISVGALLIPESLGYASVAGVPGQVGLYAAVLSLVGYALFGGSKLLVFAAAGSVAAVTAGVIGGLSGGDDGTATTLAAVLALMTGAVFLGAGLAKMGWVANFISKAVMAGLIYGMALQIIIGQIAKILGLEKVEGSSVEKLGTYISDFSQWNWTAAAIGVVCLVLIFGLERFAPKVPSALSAVILGSVVVAIWSPDIDLVDKIPQQLPTLVDPTGLDLSIGDWFTLAGGAVVVALVGFSEGWGASSSISKVTHDDLDTNQEFRAYGVANLGAGLLGGMATTGSLSKSSAAMAAGAKSQMSNLFLAALVILTLTTLAPLFQWLPEATLAAVVITAMWKSASPKELMEIANQQRVAFAGGLLVAILVLTVDLMPALLVGILLSVLRLVYDDAFPSGAVLGRGPDGGFSASEWKIGENTAPAFKDVDAVPGVLIYRHSAPLIFANAETLRTRLVNLLIEAEQRNELPHTVVLDFEAVAFADITGVETLKKFIDYCDRYGIDVTLARVHRTTAETLRNAGFENLADQSAPSVRVAVDQATGAKSGQ